MCSALPPHVTRLLTQWHQNLLHQAASISPSAVSVKHTLKRTKGSIHLNITFPALIFMIKAIRPERRIAWARAVSSMLKMSCFSELLSFCYRKWSLEVHEQISFMDIQQNDFLYVFCTSNDDLVFIRLKNDSYPWFHRQGLSLVPE